MLIFKNLFVKLFLFIYTFVSSHIELGGFDGYAEGEGTVKMMQKLWSGKF